MKVLVSGGCGFLGSNIAASFIAEGVEVIVVDALMRSGSDANLKWLQSLAKPHQLHHYDVDLAEHEAVEHVFQIHTPIDYVCHLAGQVAMTTSISDPRRDFRTNALGTLNMLEAVRRFSPNAFVAYSSTNKVYGDLKGFQYAETATRYIVPSHPSGFDESLPLDFASPYGCSKGAADQYVRDWNRTFGLQTVVFRHSSIYGGRQFATFDQGWIGWFCTTALEQRKARAQGAEPVPFTIAGTGKQVRDVLHADDLINLYRRAWESRSDVAGRIFNIGGGIENSLSLLELFAMLEELLETDPLQYQQTPRRKSDQDFFVADITASQTAMEWRPAVSARDGIARMLAWCNAKPE